MGTTERALRAAQAMIRRHRAGVGDGQAATLTATLDGIRGVRMTAPGLLVAGPGDTTRVGVALIADPLVLLVVGGVGRAFHWSLLPGGPTVTARADGLRLVRGLAAGGQLTFQMGRRVALPPLACHPGPWEYEDEWRLFEDLAVLEEWSGVTLPMPEEVSAAEATKAAQAASWARTEQVDAELSDAITFTAVEALAEPPDELRLFQDFGVELLGTEVPLGTGVTTVRLQHVEREQAAASRYRAFPARPELSFSLSPPAGRKLPPRRTQSRRISPPTVRRPAERLAHRAFKRPAVRSLSAVLETRRMREPSVASHPKGTSGLLDDIRGE